LLLFRRDRGSPTYLLNSQLIIISDGLKILIALPRGALALSGKRERSGLAGIPAKNVLRYFCRRGLSCGSPVRVVDTG
jgi:hypothetical protein